MHFLQRSFTIESEEILKKLSILDHFKRRLENSKMKNSFENKNIPVYFNI